MNQNQTFEELLEEIRGDVWRFVDKWDQVLVRNLTPTQRAEFIHRVDELLTSRTTPCTSRFVAEIIRHAIAPN